MQMERNSPMNEFESALKKLGFTQYEAQALSCLIKFKNLDATSITQYSGVPQPKVYETMEKLHARGLVDKIPMGRKWIFKIKAKSMLKRSIEKLLHNFEEGGQFILSKIETNYGTEESSEIPFVGVAGDEKINEYLEAAIEDAQQSILFFFPHRFLQDEVLRLFSVASSKIDVRIICRDESQAVALAAQLKNAAIYMLESAAFEKIKEFITMIGNFLPKDQKTPYTFEIIEKLAMSLGEIFGLAIFDEKKSLFMIPIPIDLPMAIVSTLPELIQFHNTGMQEILESCRLIENA